MAHAIARYVRLSPRKARLLIEAIRGQYVPEAVAFLRFSPQRAARPILKVVQSAAANAVFLAERDGETVDENALKIVRAVVDEGPRLKRYRPRAMGRAYPIIRPTCHITVEVQEVPRPQPAGRRARQTGGSSATPTPTNES
ncbi:MAG: 50S ribosomal protein L22 [bacterium]|nr:50S ribosomal protein L22 [bacterium]MCS7308917.1 50S ribosomal protein L22 [Armatimonadota bacterium]MDW8103555.1 50S ribosomal protein L22 [Armatimonadota bacterium]MDW8321922.1 50S ribosomal protein L22 [Armatimonadota bacterium]